MLVLRRSEEARRQGSRCYVFIVCDESQLVQVRRQKVTGATRYTYDLLCVSAALT